MSVCVRYAGVYATQRPLVELKSERHWIPRNHFVWGYLILWKSFADGRLREGIQGGKYLF